MAVTRRSRNGCSNCKLRRVKCDEDKPRCEQCRKAHVACTYNKSRSTKSELCSSHEIVFAQLPSCSTNTLLLSSLNRANSVQGDTKCLNLEDFEYFTRFRDITIQSFGVPGASQLYKTEFDRLVLSYPFLLHAAIACASMHGRSLAGLAYAKRAAIEARHIAAAAALLNRTIENNVEKADSSALWMAAVMHSFATCFDTDVSNVSLTNVFWLRVHRGVSTFYSLLSPKSPFKSCARRPGDQCLGLSHLTTGITGIPPVLAALCDLNEESNASNPYHRPVHALSGILAETQPGPLRFLAFLNALEMGFLKLLESRDARAVTLMAIWHNLVPTSAWWMWPRAQLDQRIALEYLRTYHQYDQRVWIALAIYVPTAPFSL